jgi:hypothetical protein
MLSKLRMKLLPPSSGSEWRMCVGYVVIRSVKPTSQFMELVSRLFVNLAFFLPYFDLFPVYGPPLRGFAITLRHTTIGRTPLDEWSARCRDLWQYTALNKRQTSKSPSGFEPTIPASERPQTYPLGCAATGIGHFSVLRKLIEGLKGTPLLHSLFVSHIALPNSLWLLASTCNLNTSSPHALRPWRWRQKISLKYRWRNPQTMPNHKSMSTLTSDFLYCRKMGLCLSIKSQN